MGCQKLKIPGLLAAVFLETDSTIPFELVEKHGIRLTKLSGCGSDTARVFLLFSGLSCDWMDVRLGVRVLTDNCPKLIYTSVGTILGLVLFVIQWIPAKVTNPAVLMGLYYLHTYI